MNYLFTKYLPNTLVPKQQQQQTQAPTNNSFTIDMDDIFATVLSNANKESETQQADSTNQESTDKAQSHDVSKLTHKN